MITDRDYGGGSNAPGCAFLALSIFIWVAIIAIATGFLLAAFGPLIALKVW